MLVSSLYDSKYVKAEDLRGRPVVVQIESVGLNEMGGKVGIELKFVDRKKMLRLNKTNALSLTKHLGDDTAKWKGATIELTPSQTMYQGKPVEAIRIGKVDGSTVVEAPADDDNGDIPF